MARRIVFLLIIATLPVVGANLPRLQQTACAAGLDQEGKADAKAAMGLFKQGLYEDAAKIFAKLSVDHPDMEIFERNLGACLFYLRKPEPALSSLRRYLVRKKNIAPDDKSVVDRWIDEMEKLRAQNPTASVSSPSPPPPPTSPALPPVEPEAPAPTAAEAVAAAVPFAPPAKADEPSQPIPVAASALSTTTPVPGEAPNTPAGVDLTASPTSADSTNVGSPFYRTWWFWTGTAALVVAGTVTAILLAGRSSDPCDGASRSCLGVK